MTTTFPTSLDDTTDLPVTILGTSLRSSPDHAGQHNTLSGAVVALETKVGADSSAVTTTHDYKLRDLNDPTLFLVNGVTYPLTQAGVQAAVDAAEAVRGTVRLCGDVTLTSAAIDIDAAITFDFAGHVMKAPANSTQLNGLITVIGTISGTAHTVSTNTAIGDRAVVMSSGGSSYTAGDYIFIDQPSSAGATKFFSQVCRVASVASNTLTTEESIKHVFTTAQFAQVRKWTPIEGVRILNARFDANGNTGDPTRAIYLVDVRDCYVAADSTGFNTAAAIIADRGLRNRFSVVNRDSGDLGEADIQLFRQSDYTIDGANSVSAAGFGIESFGGCNGRMLFPRATGPTGRGIKLAHEGFCSIIAPRSDSSYNVSVDYTGLSLTLFSHDLIVLAGDGHGNESYDLMIDSCDRVKVIGGRFGTATVDDIDGVCTEIEFIDCVIGTITDSHAAPTPLVQKGVTRTWRIPLVPTNATQPLNNVSWANDSGAGAIKTTFPWSCDAHGSFSTTRGHVDIADNIANYTKINFAAIPLPDDYVSSGKIVVHWSTPATSGDAIWAMSVREDFASGNSGSAGYTTILNEGTAAVGIITTTISGSADIRREVKSGVFGTAPTIGRMLEISVWSPSDNASDTLSAQRTFWGAWFEYTKRDF